MRTQNGKREWLIAWAGQQDDGKAWLDSWEPSKNVPQEEREAFMRKKQDKRMRAITIDPTPLVYSDTMYGCAGLLALGFIANAAIRPVHPSHHMPPDSHFAEKVEPWCDEPHVPTTRRAKGVGPT